MLGVTLAEDSIQPILCRNGFILLTNYENAIILRNTWIQQLTTLVMSHTHKNKHKSWTDKGDKNSGQFDHWGQCLNPKMVELTRIAGIP